MLWRILGLSVLSSVCSTMLLPNTSTLESGEEDGSTADPNTFYLPSPVEGGSREATEEKPPWSPVARGGPMEGPLTGSPWPPSGNMTGGSVSLLGLGDPAMPPLPDMTICDMLLNAPVPLPPEQIPFFCLCSHCKGTPGPKGDRGDRGPPGM